MAEAKTEVKADVDEFFGNGMTHLSSDRFTLVGWGYRGSSTTQLYIYI